MTDQFDSESFRDHRLWDEVEDVRGGIARGRSASPIDRATLSRADTVLGFLANYRDAPVALFRRGWPDVVLQLVRSVRAIGSQVSGWNQESAMTLQTVEQIDMLCDSILHTIDAAGWPSLQKESRARVFANAAESYKLQAEQSLSQLQSQAQDIEKRYSEVFSFYNHFEDTLIQHQQKYADTQAELEEERRQLAANWAVAQAEVAESSGKRLEEELKLQVKRAEEAGASLEQDAVAGKALLKLVGDQAVGDGYLKFAHKELISYRVWNSVGGFIILGVLTFLGITLWQINDLSLATIIARSAISVTAVAAAGYAIRQAGKRLKQSVEARYRALDLLALGPFIANMTGEEQKQLRLLLGTRLFAAAEKGHPEPEADKGVVDLDQLVKVITAMRSLTPGGGA